MGVLEELAAHDAADQQREAALAAAQRDLEQRSTALVDLQNRHDRALARIAELEAAARPTKPPIAVRVFPHYADTNFGDHDQTLSVLGDLGVGYVSGLLAPDLSPAVVEFYRRAYLEHGIKSWFTCGVEGETLTDQQWDTLLDIVTGPLAGAVDLLSGWNEPNHERGGGHRAAGTWEPATGRHQRALWERFGPSGLGIRIGSPQLWSGSLPDHDTDVALMAPHVDGLFSEIAWHLYPRGSAGEKPFARFDSLYHAVWPDLPVVCTEGGFFTDTAWPVSNPVTEDQQAALLPQVLDLYTSRGWGFSYFKLLDTAWTTREGTFGLVRPDWTRKPAYFALRDYVLAA